MSHPRYLRPPVVGQFGLAGGGSRQTGGMLTAFGAAAVTFMMLMYALERRGRGFILAFGCGCLLSSAYGFLAGTWPFGVVELIWAAVAFNRWRNTPPGLAV
jgi:hypothetical protein